MDEVRWIARKAAKLQLIADSYRSHAWRAGSDGCQLANEAAALERLAAWLLSGGVNHDSVDATAA
jgi:hypothetical protein